MTFARGLLLGGLACGVLLACHSAKPATSVTASTPTTEAVARGEIRRTLIGKQAAPDLPGWETRLYLIEYGPAAVAPLHVHPVVGVGLVLDGAFESAFGDQPVIQVHAGQGFVDPAGVAHRVFRNTSRDHALRFVVAYTIKAGDETFYPGAILGASLH
jgi:quercetin dioxygenase-like cupin family protein